MSIRYLALQVYEAIRNVDRLEKELGTAPLREQPRLEAELWKARKERDRLTAILEAKKKD